MPEIHVRAAYHARARAVIDAGVAFFLSDAGPRVRTHAYPSEFTLTQSMRASVETSNTRPKLDPESTARPMLRMRKYKRGVQEEESLAKLDLCYTARKQIRDPRSAAKRQLGIHV